MCLPGLMKFYHCLLQILRKDQNVLDGQTDSKTDGRKEYSFGTTLLKALTKIVLFPISVSFWKISWHFHWNICFPLLFQEMAIKTYSRPQLHKVGRETWNKTTFRPIEHAQYIGIVYAKYQKISVKALVQIDFSVFALFKHKHNPFLKASRKKMAKFTKLSFCQ